MKKTLFLFAVLLCVLSSAFATSLMMIDMDSPIYDDMEALYILEGKASPMGAKPWSELDVQHLLDWITPRTEMGIILKNKISEELFDSEKEATFHFSVSVNPQIMLHTDDSNFNVTERITNSKKLDSSMLNLGLGFSYSDNVALFMNVDLGTYISDIERISSDEGLINHQNPEYRGKNLDSMFISNIPLSMNDLNIMNFPNSAYLTAGFDAFRVYAGRSRMEWGNGVMGNMLLGDTLPFHDMLSLTFTGSKWFHYQMLVDFYTPFKNFFDNTNDRKPLEGIRFLLGHRFEFSLFSGKFIFALTDSVMYESDNMYIDPRILNPMSFLHNGFIAGNSNSLAAIEFEYTPINNFSLYGQIGIDDIAIFGEPAPPEKDSTANSIGAMFGIRFMAPMTKGYFHGNAEVVYTSPFLYHRAKGNGDLGGYDFSFISSIRYKDSKGVSGIFRYLSFPFGSDAISGLLSAGYKKPGLFDVTGNLFVMAHGVIDKFSNTRWYQDGDTIGGNTPSTSNPFNPNESGSIEYTFAFGIDGEYSPLSWLDFNVGVYFITIANLGNISGKNASDIQLSLGMRVYY